MKKRLLSLLLCMALLVGLIPASAATAFAAETPQSASLGKGADDLAETGDYLNPETPYLVTSYNDLHIFFNSAGVSGKTYYAKLTKDISYSGYETGTFVTRGGNVSLDLAGYTISVEDSSNCSFPVFYGDDGNITFTDSQRTEWRQTSSGTYAQYVVSGKVDYLYKLPGESTAVMIGDIIVKGGHFVNRCHSSDDSNTNSIYSSATNFGYGTYHAAVPHYPRLTMHGGFFEADVPINFGYSDYGSVINGGTLWIKGAVGVRMQINSKYKRVCITNVDMRNRSGNSKVVAFDIKLEDGFEDDHTPADATAIKNSIIPDDVYAYIDDVLQAQGSHGVNYDAAGGLIGPLFKSSYYLTPLTTVSQLNMKIEEPAAGKAMPYKASGDYQNGYSVSSYTSGTYSNGVQWTDGSVYTSEYPVGSTFERGKSYAVFIKVVISQKGFVFADENSMTATINGVNAMCYQSAENEFIVYHTYTIDKITVTKAPITVTEPRPGQTPDYSVKSIGTGCAVQTGYSVAASGIKNGIAWMHDGGTAMKDGEKFEAGQKYTVLVFISPSDTQKYKFADSADMTAAVNSNKASIIPYSSTSYGIFYTFDLSNQITDMAITIPSTRAGEQMKWIASVPDGVNYQLQSSSSGFSYNGVMWRVGSTTVAVGKTRYFEEGTIYKVTIFLEAKDGYTFASPDDMSARINGEEATINRFSDTKVDVSYTFTGSSTGKVTAVDVTVTPPVAGEHPVFSVTFPEGTGYQLHIDKTYPQGVLWLGIADSVYSLSSANTFAAEKVYRVRVAVEPSEGYQFAPTVTGTINGEPCPVKNSSYNQYFFMDYTFPALESAPAETIDTLEVTIPEPVAGDKLYYAATVPQGKGYAIEDYDGVYWLDGVKWKDQDMLNIEVDEANTFEAGKQYTVSFSIMPVSEQYRFAPVEDMTATVNGKPAMVEDFWDGTYGVHYTFTIPEEPAGYIVGDADADGNLTILDATCIQRKLAGLKTTSYNEKAADADEDGEVTILDATAIQRRLAGLKTNQRIGTMVALS